MQACKFVRLMILLCAAKVPLAADGGRLKHVPEADRNRVDPLLVIARADALAVIAYIKSLGPPRPPLLIPSRIRYYIRMRRTPSRLTFPINSWRSAWQTIC